MELFFRAELCDPINCWSLSWHLTSQAIYWAHIACFASCPPSLWSIISGVEKPRLGYRLRLVTVKIRRSTQVRSARGKTNEDVCVCTLHMRKRVELPSLSAKRLLCSIAAQRHPWNQANNLKVVGRENPQRFTSLKWNAINHCKQALPMTLQYFLCQLI